jgi:hypothetical protein
MSVKPVEHKEVMLFRRCNALLTDKLSDLARHVVGDPRREDLTTQCRTEGRGCNRYPMQIRHSES